MGKIKVSIIVPVYGVEKYLNTCVQSLVDQTYSNLEIILVDDESPDMCPQICNEWAKKDSRIIVIHKKNGGQGVARNAALDCSTGEYILFVDGDDLIDISMVEKMVSCTQNGTLDAVLCGITVYDGIRKVKTNWYDECKEYSNKEIMYEYLYVRKITTGPVCKLVRRYLFNNLRFPSFRANEDEYIMPKILGSCKSIYVLNEHLYIQNLRQGSTERSPFTTEKMHLIDCAFSTVDYVKEFYPEYLPLVRNKVAESCLNVLDKIYSSHDFSKFLDCEKQVLDILLLEKDKVDKSSNTYKMVCMVLNNKKKYQKILSKKNAIRYIKQSIKKFLICFKR